MAISVYSISVCDSKTNSIAISVSLQQAVRKAITTWTTGGRAGDVAHPASQTPCSGIVIRLDEVSAL